MVASSESQNPQSTADMAASKYTILPNPPCTMLRVQDTDIVNTIGEKVILKGAGVGGFLNMENFVTGYTGHEHEHRAQLTSVLGAERANFFFERLIHHFFSDADAAWITSLGLNCVRIPFNYRHFIDDAAAPDACLKPEGFALLDRVIDVCARHNLYVILDLHAVPGGQNQDWHSDGGTSRALFWDFRDHQDRAVQLWIELAKHYAGNPVVAGYNPLNEPADPSPGASRLVAWYARVEKAIREVDPEHILFIDGNTYSMDFTDFPEKPLPNAVYAVHDYSMMGFPIGEQFEGEETQKKRLRTSFERKAQYMREKGVPVWNGEFGPVYADPRVDGEAQAVQTNEKRFALLKEQLSIYAETGVSWSIWLYKDIGCQGMVYVDPESPYMKLIQPFVEKKQKLGVDFWSMVSKEGVSGVYEPFISALEKMVPEQFRTVKYPKIWSFQRQVERVVRECLLSEYLGWEMAELFRGKTEEELEELAKSFALENCKQRGPLNEILSEDAAASRPASKESS